MAAFENLWLAWPIAESIASQLGFGDLLNLSRANSSMRLLLHDFPYDPDDFMQEWVFIEDTKINSESPRSNNVLIRNLFVGQHQTSYWRMLKSRAYMNCTEVGHKRGTNAKCCRLCSMPVCEACIVKNSFGKVENLFRNRKRHLCDDCWAAGTPYRYHQYKPYDWSYTRRPYSEMILMGRFCDCSSVSDTWLCLRCKFKNSPPDASCAGEACNIPFILDDYNNTKFICSWCDLPLLPKGRSIEQYKKEFDFRNADSSRDKSVIREYRPWATKHAKSRLSKIGKYAIQGGSDRTLKRKRRHASLRLLSLEDQIPLQSTYRGLSRYDQPLNKPLYLVEFSPYVASTKLHMEFLEDPPLDGKLRYSIDCLLFFKPFCTAMPSLDWMERLDTLFSSSDIPSTEDHSEEDINLAQHDMNLSSIHEGNGDDLYGGT